MSLLDKIIENKCDVGNICSERPKIIFNEKYEDFGKIFSDMKKPISITTTLGYNIYGRSNGMIRSKADKVISKLENNPRIESFSPLYVNEYDDISSLGCFITIDPGLCKTPFESTRILFSIISIFSCIFFHINFQYAYKKRFDESLGKWTLTPSKKYYINTLNYNVYEDLIAIIEYMCGRSLTEEEYNKCDGRLTKYLKRNGLFDRSLDRLK